MSSNIIPELWAKGSFEATAPFDQVVDPKAYYTVEGTNTPDAMLADKVDLQKLVWAPVGVTDLDYQAQLTQLKSVNGAIIKLTSKNSVPVYVPSTYLKSFPLVDGVIYERLCLITDCGAVPPSFKDVMNSAIDHINNYIKDNYGLENPRTYLGTIQTRGYVPREVADAWESTRQTVIKENPSDLIRLEASLKAQAQQAAYIAELEATVKALSDPPES